MGSTLTKRVFKLKFSDELKRCYTGIRSEVEAFLLPQQVLSLGCTQLCEQITDGWMYSMLFPKAFLAW